MKKSIQTEKAPAAIGPYSQGIKATPDEQTGFVFTSGQLGLDPKTGEFAEGGIEGQARQSLMNVQAILAQSGLTIDHVIKTTVYLKNMSDFSAMNAVYAEFFQEPYPARSAVEVASLPKGGLVEIEAIACG